MTPEPANGDPTSDDKVAFLSSPATYPDGGPVELRETSMAWVFLTGDRVYKLKKPVRRRMFDYATLDRRYHACSEELRLNRRFAPDVYLGLTRLTLETDGRLALGGAGRTVDWMVRMRRLPDDRFLDRAIRAGTATQADIASVADRLVAFYQSAPGVSVSPEAHVSRYLSDLADTRSHLSAPPFQSEARRFRGLIRQLERLLRDDPGLILARVTEGRIVEGHGDLRPEHVWLGAPPLVIDCLEIAPALRHLDPFEDLSVLALECAVLGADWVGPILVARCAAALHDHPDDRLLAFYLTHRATLRARQALAHLVQPTPREPEKWHPLARTYLDAAERGAPRLDPGEDRSAIRSRGAAPPPRQKAARR